MLVRLSRGIVVPYYRSAHDKRRVKEYLPPDLPICEMLEGESESKAFLFEIVPIDGDSIIDELTFFLVEESSLLREVGDENVS